MTKLHHTYQSRGKIKQVLHEYTDSDSLYQLVLIHGIADSADVWRGTCKMLQIRFSAYHELNLQWSIEVGDPISYEPSPEQILFDAWKRIPKGKKIVFAHSFGVSSLLAMLQSQPLTDVAAIIMLSVYFKPKYDAFDWPMFVRYVNEFEKFLASSIAVRSGADAMSERSKEIILQKTKQMYSPSSWMQFYMTFSKTPGLDLSRLNVPVLVLGGAKDFSIDHEDTKAFVEKLPDADFVLFEDCGHFAMLEKPTHIANTIYDFLIKRDLLCRV